MATESVEYVAPETKPKTLLSIFRRPDQHTKGIVDWLTTIDHKKIGLLYGLGALCFLIFGGMQALAIRTQLWGPGQEFLTPRQYNQMFTMHGTFDNHSPQGRVRLSCDVRWQPASDPLDPRYAGSDPPGTTGIGYGELNGAKPLTEDWHTR